MSEGRIDATARLMVEIDEIPFAPAADSGDPVELFVSMVWSRTLNETGEWREAAQELSGAARFCRIERRSKEARTLAFLAELAATLATLAPCLEAGGEMDEEYIAFGEAQERAIEAEWEREDRGPVKDV